MTAPTFLLRNLQKIYPPSEFTNMFLDIFEILSFYSRNVKSEDQIAATKSSIMMLKEFTHVAKTLKPYLELNSNAFSEEEHEKLRRYFNVDADFILELVEEMKLKV